MDTAIAVAAYLLPFVVALICGYALGRTRATRPPTHQSDDDHDHEGARR